MSKGHRRIRGIIVWDFDGVLFRTLDLVRDNEEIFKRYRIPLSRVPKIALTSTQGQPFSITRLARAVRGAGIPFPIRAIRRDMHRNLLKCGYADPVVDCLLHRLKKKGFMHMILSFGSPPFQYKKITIGCGSAFLRHFAKIKVTTGQKYPFLRLLSKRYTGVPIFFVDDTKKHIDLVRQHVPEIITFYLTKKKTLRDVERFVTSLRYGKKR